MLSNRWSDMETDNWNFLNKNAYFSYDFQSSNLQSNGSMCQHGKLICSMIIFYVAIEGKNNFESFPSYTMKIFVVNYKGTSEWFYVKNMQ